MFIELTDATTGKHIVFKKDIIAKVEEDRKTCKGADARVSKITFIDDIPYEWVEETVHEIYKKLINS